LGQKAFCPKSHCSADPRSHDCRPVDLCIDRGNVWRKKDKSQEEFTIGDWQLPAKLPCIYDFLTLFICLDATKVDTVPLVTDYHNELCNLRPDVAETYPVDMMVKDVAVGYTCSWLLVIPVFAGITTADLPPEKAEFTFKSYLAPVFINCMLNQARYDLDGITQQVLAGEYT
jgi:hypothetical protein